MITSLQTLSLPEQSTSKGKEKTNKKSGKLFSAREIAKSLTFLYSFEIAITKKKKTASTKSKTTKLSQIELYKALRASSSRHEPNLKNIKRKFFKHNPDQISGIGGSSNNRRNNQQKPPGSVFSDRDFENFMSK